MQMYKCKFPDCEFQTKYKNNLKNHESYIHDINVKWFKCRCIDCSYKFKKINHLNRHYSVVHDINVIWYKCKHCSYESKRKDATMKHEEIIHDIGKNKCEICFSHRNSKILHDEMYICRMCFNKLTGKNSRIEKTWSDYIDEKIGVEFLLSNDKSLKHNGGCTLKRPDKIYTGLDIVEIDECDEHQHLYNNGDYTCDEQRLSELYDEDGICGKTMIVIRWNPHKYMVPSGYKHKNLQERLDLHVKLKQHLRTKPTSDKIHVYYMFYDKNNPRICKNLPFTMIYDIFDFPQFTH